MIHVCFGLYDKTGRYSKFTGTAMLSMFENTASNVTVHILHDNTLSADNRDKFIYLAGQYGQLVKFYNVEELCADKLAEIRQLFPDVIGSRFSIATFYRFCITDILPAAVEKIIYLDSDIVVNMDIAQLWRVDLGDKIFAVVPENANYDFAEITSYKPLCRDNLVDVEDYFNAGVLLMNLTVFRRELETLVEGTKFIGQSPQYNFADQDVLNYCFATRTVKLPVKFNRFVSTARAKNEFDIGNKIYHYAIASLRDDMNDPYNRLWMDYFMRTPWFDAEAIGRLYAEVRRIDIGFKSELVQLSAMMSGKSRAFFAASANIDTLRKIFFIRPDEEIIPADAEDAVPNLVYAMGRSLGRKVFYIIVQDFESISKLLQDVDFVLGRDFVNGVDFLSEEHGKPPDSHDLIKAM